MNGMHGEVVSWDFASGTRVAVGAVRAALEAAGLNAEVATDLTARTAFARAAESLAEQRIIRKVSDTGGTLVFQFTREGRGAVQTAAGDEARLTYNYEALLTLDKGTRAVTCPDAPDLAVEAARLIADESAHRNVSDLTRMVNRLFRQSADLFPVRSQGGCYFCPERFADFLNKIETFLHAVGGNLRRFPVPKGVSASADRSIKETVEEGLRGIMHLHEVAIAEFDLSTRDKTLEGMVTKINQTRIKVEGYAEYLRDRSDAVLAEVDALRAKLRAKVAETRTGAAERLVPQASLPAGAPAPGAEGVAVPNQVA